jgi:hypothetical protein
MNEKGHAVNAVLLGAGTGIMLDPSMTLSTVQSVVTVGVPVVLGALFPDLDTTFGTHRKTLHNAIVLGTFAAFPYFFGNLHYVWLGVTTHYVLDLLGNVRGMAVFYPHSELYDIPVGVPVTSRWADAVTLAVTAFELAVVGALIWLGRSGVLRGPLTADLFQYVP